MHIVQVILILVGLSNLILTIIVYNRNPKNNVNVSFALFTLIATIWSFSVVGFLIANDISSAFFWSRVTYVWETLVPVSFITFSYAISERKFPSYLLRFIYFFEPFLFIAFILFAPQYFIGSIDTSTGEKVIHIEPLYILWIIYFASFMLYATFIIWEKYRKSFGFAKLQLYYTILAILIPFVLAFPFTFLFPLFGNNQFIFVYPSLLVLMVAVISYAIIKHRFLDIRFVIARSVAYSFLITVIALIYSGGLFVIITYVVKQPTIQTNLVVSTLLAIGIAFSFQSLKRIIEKATDRIFYKGGYYTDILLGRIGKILTSTLVLSYLSELIFKELLSEMKISFAFLFVMKDSSIQYVKGAGNVSPIDFDLEKVQFMTNKSFNSHRENILVFDETPESEEKKIMRTHNIHIVLPLLVEKKLVGVILLGQKSSGEVYSDRDINVLKIFGSEAALGVKNALSYEEIKHFNKTLSQQIQWATKDLKKANEQLKQLDRLKDEFVSIVSHELRTPLTVIKSYLWTVLEKESENLTKGQSLSLQRAFHSTNSLIHLVNDMLNVSRIESGRITLAMHPTNLGILLFESVNEIMPKAKEAGITVKIRKSEKEIPPVNADKERVKQILFNLIGNSLKFTPPKGTITLSLSVKDNMVVTKISDTGIGVKKADIPKLFQKFGTVRETYLNKGESQGTGLGLYISKSLIEMQGGTMWAESKGKNKGASFYFSLKPIITS